MKYRPKVYTASKIHHRAMWLTWRETYAAQLKFTSRWIETPPELPEHATGYWTPEQERRHWIYNVQDVLRADFVIAYLVEDEKPSGTILECGIALGHGKIVLPVGFPPVHSWQSHPLVFSRPTIKSAIDFILER